MRARNWMGILSVICLSGASAHLAWADAPKIEDGRIFTTSKVLEFGQNNSDQPSNVTLESEHKFREGFCQLDKEIPAHSTMAIPQGTQLKFKYVAPTGFLSFLKKTKVMLTNPETGADVAELTCSTGLSVDVSSGATEYDGNELEESHLLTLGLTGVSATVGSGENKSQPAAPSDAVKSQGGGTAAIKTDSITVPAAAPKKAP
jgi:hypothetical protein